MARGRKPDNNQYQLAWDAAKQERRQLIRAVPYERVQIVRSEITRTEWRNAQELLCYLASIEGPDGIFPKQASMAAAIGRSDRTVRAILVHLEAIEIINSRRRGSTSNAYDIGWSKLATLGIEQAVDDRQKTAGQSGKNFQSDRKFLPVRPAKISDRHIRNYCELNCEIIPPPPPQRWRRIRRRWRRTLLELLN